jgi:hypothetical protein
MSVAKLKEEGDNALHKENYDAALEFYTMVCYCTICAPEVHFFSRNIAVSFYSLQWLTSVFCFFLDARANFAWVLFLFSCIFLLFLMSRCKESSASVNG